VEFFSLHVSLHFFSVGGLTCYDGNQVGVNFQREVWVLEDQWVYGIMAGGSLEGPQRLVRGYGVFII
jgi:hypothetical protein